MAAAAAAAATTPTLLPPPLPLSLQQARRVVAAPPPPLAAAAKYRQQRCAGVAAAAPRRRRRGGASAAGDASLPQRPPPPPPTQQLLPAVALDVEYAHVAYELPPPAPPPPPPLPLPPDAASAATNAVAGPAVVVATRALPAWVALVDEAGAPLLKTHVDARGELLPLLLPPSTEGGGAAAAAPQAGASGRLRTVGGVPLEALRGAPPLRDVVAALRRLAAGKLLLGHHLAKDLAALGWHDHPVEARLDTMTHRAFGNRAGNARSLRRLARDFLGGRVIQRPGAPHDPEEDAAAVMALYVRVVRPSALASSYEGAVAAAEARLLADIERRRRRLQEEREQDGEEEEAEEELEANEEG